MKEILENSSNEKPTKVREASSSSFLIEALVPLNPYRWSPYVAGTAFASDQRISQNCAERRSMARSILKSG